ncbi:MAG: hydroxymethylglutaryl-CoA lyase [Bacteroidota bacterium]|nr:hydroxymethylglutaryl-CoA lyase [Bacteroidota bacterium]
METVKIIECPRDAMQGIKTFIPTDQKVAYLQALLRVGFDVIDFGSFVSSRAIAQMQDTAAVLDRLDLSQTKSKLLAIIANTKGAQMAAQHSQIDFLGFPFSISENFQMRNTHKTIAESLISLEEILSIAYATNKEVVAYLSMGFGNPYGDPWNIEIVSQWVDKLAQMGVKILSLSDTVGSSNPEDIQYLYTNLIAQYPDIEFGAHFHTTYDQWFEKVNAAYQSGCRRFDGAIQGFGGCPMATNHLTGNMPTEKLLSYCTANKIKTGLNPLSFESAYNEASKLFGRFV